MPIPFTDREMQKAWRQNLSASCSTTRNNAHRLLLFYAVECGLKAILMKRQKKHRTDLCNDIPNAQHNINKLLDYLGAGQNIKLPSQLMMEKIKIDNLNQEERKFTPGEINQMWRYGGYSIGADNDEKIEEKLIKIAQWIDRELKI